MTEQATFTSDVQALSETIRTTFPDFHFSKATLAMSGDDHIVLIVDDAWVFRFPRSEEYARRFLREVKLLKTLRIHTTVPVPEYVYVSEQLRFGGYPMLQGDPATGLAFERLSRDRQSRFLGSMAQFLTAIHRLPTSLVVSASGDEDRTPAWFRRRYLAERRDTLGTLLNARIADADRFYEKFIELAVAKRTFVHGDLLDRHMLIDGKGTVTGVIDFGDAAVSDPAYDFGFFWRYGEEAVSQLYERYESKDDRSLVLRSRYYFMRYVLDELYFSTLPDNTCTDDQPTLLALLDRDLSSILT
jgi:aminoglycoside phosphotransferase (APT) family kinase protein